MTTDQTQSSGQSSFIERVELRASQIRAATQTSISDSYSQAITEALSESGPVAEVMGGVLQWHIPSATYARPFFPNGTLLFTAPQPTAEVLALQEQVEKLDTLTDSQGAHISDLASELGGVRGQLAAAQVVIVTERTRMQILATLTMGEFYLGFLKGYGYTFYPKNPDTAPIVTSYYTSLEDLIEATYTQEHTSTTDRIAQLNAEIKDHLNEDTDK
jgi:hypothetical protein